MADKLELQTAIIIGCGEVGSYWCLGHIDDNRFRSLIAESSDEIGFDATVPDHIAIQRAWQTEELCTKPGLEGEVIFVRHYSEVPNSIPITFVFGDEVDEV